jgi:DNA-binding transcriptional ArsR family regulator
MSRLLSARATVELGRAAPLFAALGDRTRLRLVSRLCAEGPASIAHLTSGTGVTRQAVTKHLRILEEAGLVRGTQLGRQSCWALQSDKLAEARKSLELISQQWDQTLDRLKAFVEEGEE